MSQTDLIPLQFLAFGDCGQIESVVGNAADVQRFAELGWKKGASVQILRAGNPCIAEVRGERMCFRPGDGLEILVRSPQRCP